MFPILAQVPYCRAGNTLSPDSTDYFLPLETGEAAYASEARVFMGSEHNWAVFLCGPRRRELGPAALRALRAARRLARRLGLLPRGSLGGGGGRRLLATGGRDAAQLLPRHVSGTVRLDAFASLQADTSQ